ncbi:hypothetical protein C6P45_003889, partial [Maudiozyma exigua]
MQFASALALLSAVSLSAAYNPTPEETAELMVMMDDVNNRFSDYTNWFITTVGLANIPNGIVDVYMARHTATDNSYTTLFTAVDVPALLKMATEVPWYSSYLSSEIASAIAA